MPENTVSLASVLVGSAHRYRKDVMTMVLASVEDITAHMKTVEKLKGKETQASIVPQAHFRPYSSEKKVTGTAGITARTLETFALEILEEFDPEELYKTVFGQPVDVEKINLDIVRRLITEEMKNACRGLCDAIFVGVRNATGTNNLDCFDGFDTIIASEKAAGNISFTNGNFMALGEESEYNIGDLWGRAYSMLDESLKGDSKKKLKLFCSFKEKEMYNNWYAMKFGHGNFAGVPDQKYLHGTDNKVEIVALPGMGASKHFFISTEDNVKVGYDVSPKSAKYEVRRCDNPNLVQFHVVIYFGVDFANIEKQYLFAASRTVKSDAVYVVPSTDEIVFDDTALGSSDTATLNLKGFNITSATQLSIEGANAAMFRVSANSASADDINGADGKDITVTFSPTTAAGDKTAKLRLTNTTDSVSMLITLKGKATA